MVDPSVLQCVTTSIQASVVDESDFLYNILLRTGVVAPEDEALALTGEEVFNFLRTKN